MHHLSNIISTIKVGYINKNLDVLVQNTKCCIKVLNTMYNLGYIRGLIILDKKRVKVLLKYINKKPSIRNINIISTPGRRMYVDSKFLKKRLLSDTGVYILSTSKGILTDLEATMFNVGGEIILKIS